MRRGFGIECALWFLALLGLSAGFGLGATFEPTFESRAKEPGVLRVVTWNIGLGVGEGADSMDRVQHVVHVLRELDADWVFLQELKDSLQVRRIAEGLGSDWQAHESGHEGRMLAGFDRTRDLEFSRVRAGEGALGLRSRRHDCEVRVVHADAYSAEARNKQLGREMTSLESRPGRKLLVGDLNLDLDLGKRGDLFSDDDYLDVETYNYLALRLQDATRGTGSTAEPDRRLDYIFCEARGFEVLDAGPWRGHRAAGMDHDPVVCDLRPR